MQTYIAGNIIETVGTFTADDNVTPIDPSSLTVTYTVRSVGTLYGPYTITYSGATTPATGQIAKLSAGVYECRLDTTFLPGYWQYTWNGTGTGQVVLPVSAVVYDPHLATS